MTSWYKWKVRCQTDNKFYSVITEDTTEPTVCPDNSAHSVVPGSGFITQILKQDAPRLNSVNDDGRLIVSQAMFPDWMNPCFTSYGDDFANGHRGDGTKFFASFADGAPTSTILEFRFIDYIQMLGGTLRAYNGNIDDYFSADVFVPGTDVVVNNTNTGNCVLLDLSQGAVPGGLNVIIPAHNNGTHDVDITSADNPNVDGTSNQCILVTKACPVSSVDENDNPTGNWDWNRHTGEIASAVPGQGMFNLYTFPIVLAKYINKVSVFTGNNSPFEQSMTLNHRGGPLLPHWRFRITMTRASSHAPSDPPVIYNGTLIIARSVSTNSGDQ